MKDKSNITGTMKQILPFKPSTLETIDYSVYNWLTEEMELFCTTNKGRKEVPVVWVSGERSWQVKNHKNLRDSDGALIFPIISLQRNSFSKDPQKRGAFYGNIPPVKDEKGGSVTIARQVNQNKTANFLNADAYKKKSNIVGNMGNPGAQQINFPNRKKAQDKKIVYETITIPMPVYIDVEYQISIRTEYQEQINELVQPFITTTNGINYLPLKHDSHSYEGFLQPEFSSTNNVAEMGDETRIYESTISLKVLGYVFTEGTNAKQPTIVKRQNAVEIKVTRERVMLGDEPEWIKGKYLP